jgi:spore coat protein CotH
MRTRVGAALVAAFTGFLIVSTAPDGLSQPVQLPGGKGKDGKDGKFGPGGFGFGPGKEKRPVVKDFDKNGDGWLNKEERAAARESLKKGGGFGPGFGGPKGFGPKGGDMPVSQPGPKVAPADVKNYPDAALYDTGVLRTIFLEFENSDWEAELQDFHGTDVDVPATLTVDGKKYTNVGVRFRGMSSYMMVPAGYKRSLNVSLNLADPEQRLYGHKTLNLLNSHEDPAMMSTVLFSHIARKYIPCPKANFVKVVINGESWGVYVSAQQFDKVFLNENYKTTKGTRWKVPGPGPGGLEYIGDDVAPYKRRFQIKSQDDEKAWKALVNLCKVLNQTQPDKLEEALRPIADVDGLLWFLALDVALINGDGYWTRASDYSLYLDEKGKFHFIPHDMNECFRPAGGPGFGPPGGGFIMMRPNPGEVLPPPLQDVLQLTEEQKKKLAELQKDVDAKLEKLLTEDQRKQLKEMKERGPGGFGGGMVLPGGPPFGPPGGFPGGGPPGGPGGMGPRGGGLDLDPLIGLDDPRKPLRSKVLAVPSLKAKYLACVRTIAEEALDWKKLGPVVAEYRKLISFEAFKRNSDDVAPAPGAGGGGPGMPPGRGGFGMNLRAFAEQRQKYLLNHPQVKKPTP